MTNVLIEFPRQLELPLVWWHDTNLWRERRHVSSVQRPVEDEALDNVYYSSRAMSGKFGRGLNGLERKVYFLELLSISRNPKYFTAVEHQRWIAAKSRLSVPIVKDILNGVRHVIHELVRTEDLAINQAWKITAKEILQELEAERCAMQKFAA